MFYDTQLERQFHACVTGALLGRVTLVTFPRNFSFLISGLLFMWGNVFRWV